MSKQGWFVVSAQGARARGSLYSGTPTRRWAGSLPVTAAVAWHAAGWVGHKGKDVRHMDRFDESL